MGGEGRWSELSGTRSLSPLPPRLTSVPLPYLVLQRDQIPNPGTQLTSIQIDDYRLSSKREHGHIAGRAQKKMDYGQITIRGLRRGVGDSEGDR